MIYKEMGEFSKWEEDNYLQSGFHILNCKINVNSCTSEKHDSRFSQWVFDVMN